MTQKTTSRNPHLPGRSTTRHGAPFLVSFLLLSWVRSRVAGMSAPDASTPARDAIDAFLRHLAERDLSATTRRIRKTYLNEYLRHAQQAAAAGADGTDGDGTAAAEEPGGAAARPLTAGDLMGGDR